MMNNIRNNELLNKTKSLVTEERRITLELIDHLREIERRMLFAEMGFGSLFEFCTKYLGLSEGSAQRRIAAMRLARDLPEARASLESGSLSLSNAAKLHSVFQAQKKKGEVMEVKEKKKVLESITHLSQRECEQKLFEVMPNVMSSTAQEKERTVSTTHTEIKLIVGPELHRKLQRLRELLSHSVPDRSYLKLLEYIADQEIARLERKKGITRAETSTAAAVRTEKVQSSNNIKTIPAPIRRLVWHQARGQCQYPGCTSRYKLEIDHRTPRSHGGSNEIQNLRLLCASHNRAEAVRVLGSEAMRSFLPGLDS